jgi:hypothetical protein
MLRIIVLRIIVCIGVVCLLSPLQLQAAGRYSVYWRRDVAHPGQGGHLRQAPEVW